MLGLVTAHPGITVGEIAQRLGIDATGLYRVVRQLIAAGQVRKDGPRLYPGN
jgi:DNA-binding IclR family transcriptional regulator